MSRSKLRLLAVNILPFVFIVLTSLFIASTISTSPPAGPSASAQGKAEGPNICAVIRAGDISGARKMLEDDPDLAMFTESSGETPLHQAAFIGDVELIDLLLRCGADIDAKNGDGQTALLYAAYDGKTEAVKLLLDKGAAFDYQDTRGNSPLLFAARQGFADVVEILLERGASPDVPGAAGKTPCFNAAARGHIDILRMLEEAGADINRPDEDGKSPVLEAILGGHSEVVEYLVVKGALDLVSKKEYNEILHQAAAQGIDPLVESLLAGGGDIRSAGPGGTTLLHNAVKGGMKNVASGLIRKGLDVDAVDDRGRTALMLAVGKGDLPAAAMLVEAGADVDIRAGDGASAWTRAEDWQDSGMIGLLERSGAKKHSPEPLELASLDGGKMLEIRYIGNEGFLAACGDRKVMFDAFVDNPWGYCNTGERLFSMMLAARPPFDGVDLNIASHNHADHFIPQMTLDHMKANGDVTFICNQRSYEDMKRTADEAAFEAISPRILSVNPEWGRLEPAAPEGWHASFFGADHAGPGRERYMTLESLVEIGGATLLHLADIVAESSEEYLRSALEGQKVDIAFIDRFFLADSIGSLLVEEVIRPEYIIMMHLRPGEVDEAYGELIGKYPNLLVFHDQMERKYFR